MMGELHPYLGLRWLDLRWAGPPREPYLVPICAEDEGEEVEGGDGEPGSDTLHSSQHAWQTGQLVGQEWGHDPYALACSLGADVRKASEVELVRLRGRPLESGRKLLGRLVLPGAEGERPQIHILNTLTPAERALTLAHECCHLMYPAADLREDLAEEWATAFIGAVQGV